VGDVTGSLDRVRQRLQQRYLDSMPMKISMLESSLRRQRGGAPDDAAKRARRLAHQIRGSAASFGFFELGTLAGHVEDASDDLLPARLAELIAALRETTQPQR